LLKFVDIWDQPNLDNILAVELLMVELVEDNWSPVALQLLKVVDILGRSIQENKEEVWASSVVSWDT